MIIAKNKKSYHDFTFGDSYEAGIVLQGAEVKQIRNSRVNLKGSYCRFFKDELFLVDCSIAVPDTCDTFTNYEEKRIRKLLLHKKQLKKLKEQVDRDGASILCRSIYTNDSNKIKIDVAIGKGNTNYDKRNIQKDRDIQRKLQRKDYD